MLPGDRVRVRVSVSWIRSRNRYIRFFTNNQYEI